MGNPCADVGRRVCQRIAPVDASYAYMLRSQSPPNTRPPAVASAAVLLGDAVRCRHNVLPVFTSIAWNSPSDPPERGCLRSLRCTGPTPPRTVARKDLKHPRAGGSLGEFQAIDV